MSGARTPPAGSPFLALLVGLFMIGAAFALWIELLMREAAVYVIVLMLPLAFAAMVWPARRIWAVRAVELLVALILSKFAIVAVLVARRRRHQLGADGGSVSAVMTGAVLVLLAAFSPWALLRLIRLPSLLAAPWARSEARSAGRIPSPLPRARRMSGARSPRLRCGAMRRPPGPTRDRRRRLIPASPGVTVRVRTAGVAVRVRTAGAIPPGDDPLPDPVFDWPRIPTLELGPNGTGGSTGVWPHEDAS